MIVNQLQSWLRSAPTAGRADGASALARAYLYSDIASDQRHDAERILTSLLDDPSPLVRRALAEAFASAKDAPHHIVLALADDQSSIASIVLARSPVLTEAELIDCAAVGDAISQAAIAGRPAISASVAAALAEVGEAEALIVLAGNRGAPIPTFSLHRMVERHGDDGALRETMLNRPDLPQSVRFDLVVATTRALAAFVSERAWLNGDRMGRLAAEARDKAVITIAATARADGAADLVKHLRDAGQLTVGLAFRAILSGRLDLFSAILAELAGAARPRTDVLVRSPNGLGFASLYRKSGLPDDLFKACRIALQTVIDLDFGGGETGLRRPVVERVLTACDTINNGELDKLLVLLRRFESEAAREDVRLAAERQPLILADAITTPLVLNERDGANQVRSTPRVRSLVNLASLERELCAA